MSESSRMGGKAVVKLLAALVFFLGFCFPVEAQPSVVLAWNPSLDSAVTGYTIYYGTNTVNFSSQIDAGTNTSIEITGLAEGETNYFAIASYDSSGDESALSSPIAYLAPGAPEAQTGSLEVTLNAPGAQWAVDNGTMQSSGATVSGLSVGAHTVSFSTVSGWTTPASQTVSVTANQTTSASGTYVAIPQTGSLEVTLNAPGAQWVVDGGAMQNSGATVSNLSVGAHTVSFSAVTNWTTPASQTISIADDQTNSISGTYVAVPQTGSLEVTLNVAGAKWAVDNGTMRSSGATVSGLSVGSHTISFSTVSGWTTPASQTVSVAANQTTSASGTYVAIAQTGSLEVTLNAPDAQWAVDNGAMQNSGVTNSGLSVGSHTITFSEVSGWTTPASLTVSVAANQMTSTNGTYVAIAQTGSLEVTLNAPGAQWAVDNGTMQNSGATVSGLSVGSHTITFSAVSGWTTPANQTVSVAANQTTSASGTYVAIAQTGSLEVTLNAPGAQWAVDNGAMQNSGATNFGLSVGEHTISFSAVDGWTTPASLTVSVAANQMTSTNGTYVAVAQTGSLEVTLNAPGAQWAVDNGAMQNSGATVSGLSVGSHTISFSAVSGWTTPASQTVSIADDQTNSVNGTYVAIAQTSSLEVTLNAPGAQWAVDSGTMQNSGATVSGLSVGTHTISFSAVSGWTTPVKQTVSLAANQSVLIAATYTAVPPSGSLQVTLTPAAAQWAVDSGTMQNSGTIVSGLSVGTHTVSFGTVNGWITPSNQTVSISTNQTNTIIVAYVTNSATTSVTTTNGTPTLAEAKATYNGLFYPAEAVTETTSGMLSSLVVKTNGKYTGKLILNGSSLPFTGAFNTSGQASQRIVRGPRAGGALTLEMTLTWNNGLVQIAGTVSGTNGGPWTANLLADAAAVSAKSYEYTLLIPPATNAPENSPPGYGYASITNHAGTAHVAGALADATAFSQSVPVSADGAIPLYVKIGQSELLMGWVTNLYSQSPGGEIVWIKNGSKTAINYKGGFTNTVAVLGSVWDAPVPKTAAVDLTNAALSFMDGGLAAPLNFAVTVESNNTVVKSGDAPTNTVSGVINPKTGLIHLTFEDGTGRATRIAYGAFLQNSQTAAGYFVNTTNRGGFELEPAATGGTN